MHVRTNWSVWILHTMARLTAPPPRGQTSEGSEPGQAGLLVISLSGCVLVNRLNVSVVYRFGHDGVRNRTAARKRSP